MNLPVNTSDVAALKTALLQTYERHSPAIFRYAFRILGNRELTEDCVADTFLRLLIAVRGGLMTENIRVYLFRIAHIWITDYYSRHPPVQLTLKDNVHVISERHPSQLTAQELDRRRMRLALLQLPVEQRQVFELAFMENWSSREVAEVLGKTVEETRALRKCTLEALRQILARSSLFGPFL
jgi:RNA polymerase sigma-70 factor (ECF subfamily)